jgi:Protein of unknown function, DUF481
MSFRSDILCVFLLVVSLHARDKIDVMVMKNGDRMTCAVKGLASGVLYVDFDYIDGTASVDWSKVARLESKQLFLVKTEGGVVYRGTLSTPEQGVGRPLKIQVVETPEQEAVLDRSQVVQIIATSDKFWQRFNGGISWGVIYAKGNQSTQYSLSSDASYVRERWVARANFASNLSSSTGITVSTRNSVNFGALHLLPWNHWFYSGLGGFLQSSEQGITLQSTFGGGIGRYLTNTNRASVALLGGIAWQDTSYKESALPQDGQHVAAALVYAEAKLFKFSKTNLDATAGLLPALSDPGRVRFNANASYYIKIIGNLKWNISFYGNWDNRSPPGFSGSDYGTSSGLSWTFGLK